MNKKLSSAPIYDIVSDNMALMGKIYQSFEALEQTLGALKMEEPLFMTYAAKKSFTDTLMKQNQNTTFKN